MNPEEGLVVEPRDAIAIMVYIKYHTKHFHDLKRNHHLKDKDAIAQEYFDKIVLPIQTGFYKLFEPEKDVTKKVESLGKETLERFVNTSNNIELSSYLDKTSGSEAFKIVKERGMSELNKDENQESPLIQQAYPNN